MHTHARTHEHTHAHMYTNTRARDHCTEWEVELEATMTEQRYALRVDRKGMNRVWLPGALGQGILLRRRER